VLAERTVTLTVHRRPAYLREVLAALAAVRGIADWHLVVGLEPGSEECAALCEAIAFMPRTIRRNAERLGVRANPFQLLDFVFGRGAALNVYLEDDTVPSPDATALATWYAGQLDGDRWAGGRSACLGLFSYSTGGEPPDELMVADGFLPWGLAFTRVQWEAHFRPYWWLDEHRFTPYTDWTLGVTNHLRDDRALTVLLPRLSRVRNIGRLGGTHASPERHDAICEGIVAAGAAGPFAYRVNPDVRPRWRGQRARVILAERAPAS
jgi:hypothetical protein